MAYSFQTFDVSSFHNSTNSLGNLGLPGAFNAALVSVWLTVPDGGVFFDIGQTSGGSTGIDFEIGNSTVFLSCGNGPFIGTGPGSHSVAAGTMVNFLCSIDGPTNQAQCYINDAPIALTMSWNTTHQIGNDGTGYIIQGSGSGFPGTPGFCIGDVWFAPQTSFTDLSITSNRRKFINADLTPADVGSNGQNPFGSAPPMFLHAAPAGSPADYIANLGTGGGFNNQFPYGICAVFPVPPASHEVTMADLWFGPTATFVDLGAQSNRRKFVGVDGSGTDLGFHGEKPFGVSPPIFLTRASADPADAWANNKGNGGAFSIANGDLTTSGGGPPCSTATTVFIDDGLAGVQGADPQVRLSVSDDGGMTWSTFKKWRSMGKIGQYKQRLRWLKMGQFRQRIIRLEITDPVRRNIVGFYQDTSEGMG